jgi:hypothetical protein
MMGAWIALAMLVVCASLAQTPETKRAASAGPPVTRQSNNKTDKSPNPTVKAPLPVAVIKSDKDVAHDSERETKADEFNAEYLQTQETTAKASKKQVFTGRLVVGIAFIDTLVAVGALLFVRRTYLETQRMANAAHDQVLISRDIGNRQLRAYIFSKGTRMENFESGPIRIRAETKNAGLTPAYRLQKWAICEPFDNPLPKDFKFREAAFGGGKQVQNPGDGPQILVEPKVHLTDEIKTAIKSGQKSLYFWGGFRYDDAFGVERKTFFRLVWEPKEDVWWYCDEGNSAD